MDIIKNSSAWLKKNRIIVVRFASSTINCTVFVKSLKLFVRRGNNILLKLWVAKISEQVLLLLRPY